MNNVSYARTTIIKHCDMCGGGKGIFLLTKSSDTLVFVYIFLVLKDEKFIKKNRKEGGRIEGIDK